MTPTPHAISSALQKIDMPPGLIRSMARQTGFSRRNSGKIGSFDFFLHTCILSMKGSVSFNDLAASLELHTPSDASRQACAQRMDERALCFFQQVFATMLHQTISPRTLFDLSPKLPFFRILLQDSTVISLPGKLFPEFSGVANAHAKRVHARVQCVYDLIGGNFLYFSIDPYSRTDLAVAPETHCHSGDLLLRDRGYFSLESFGSQQRDGSFFIQRYKHKTLLLDSPDASESIELLSLLRKKGSIDRVVYFPNMPNLPFRILAFPVPEEVANLRRMKAKKENKGHNPSSELLALMGWSIYITNLLDPAFTPPLVARLYGLRWRIENIFKTWKSNMHFQKCHAVASTQLRVLLLARFSMLCLFYHRFFVPLFVMVLKKTGRMLSLMKFMRYMELFPSSIIRFVGSISTKTLKALVKHCCYDLRKRKNYMQELEDILNDIQISLA